MVSNERSIRSGYGHIKFIASRRHDIHLVISLAVMLLFILPANIAWAQNPLEPPDTSSPRATLKSFLDFSDEIGRRYNVFRESPSPATQQALQPPLAKMMLLLDLSELSPAAKIEAGREAAILLWEILARLELPPLGEVPGRPTDPTESTDDKLPAQWRIPHTSIVITQVTPVSGFRPRSSVSDR